MTEVWDIPTILSGVCDPEDPQVHMEIRMLLEAGCTPEDFEFAVNAWHRARSIGNNWGYIRAAVFCHRAEVRLIQEGQKI